MRVRVETSPLPLPEIISEQNQSHSFKNLNRTTSSKKPPKLNVSRIRHLSSSSAQPITFRDDVPTHLSPIYQKELPESYFHQCFEIVSKIGEGSFGEVFKVRSKEDGQLYAVKKSKEYFRSKEYRRERLEEVKRYEEFSEHEHCVTMYKAWEQDYQLYMQMELCHGSLEGYVLENRVITEPQIWSFLLDLLLALKSFHDRNLIHLDVKLDNILITEDGVCKLGDFGLMFDLQRETEKAVEGDCRYMAPEELEGRFTKAADIFSLGITILELSCNLELPANGVLWQQLRIGIFPAEIVNLLSPEIFHIIRWMMAPDWRDRPTVDALLAHGRLQELARSRRKWALVNTMKRLRRRTWHFGWQKWSLLKKWLVQLVLAITTFFKLRHEKRPEDAEFEQQTTPKCNQSQLLARLDAINFNGSAHGGGAMDDSSSDSALGVEPHLPDGQTRGSPRNVFPECMLEAPNAESSTIYSSTPIIPTGMNLRRSRLQTPNSPLSNGSFSRSELNTSEHVSSFTAKKLFDQSDDSD